MYLGDRLEDIPLLDDVRVSVWLSIASFVEKVARFSDHSAPAERLVEKGRNRHRNKANKSRVSESCMQTHTPHRVCTRQISSQRVNGTFWS